MLNARFGSELCQKGDFAAAIPLLEQAIGRNPKDTTLYNLGAAMMREKVSGSFSTATPSPQRPLPTSLLRAQYARTTARRPSHTQHPAPPTPHPPNPFLHDPSTTTRRRSASTRSSR